MGEGSTERDYRGTKGVVDDADPPPSESKFKRGRIDESKVVSPRPAVRDPGEPTVGDEGEPAYGAPLSTPKPKPESEDRKKVKPDPLKKKEHTGNPY